MEQFRDSEDPCVLILNESGEEGLNLAFVIGSSMVTSFLNKRIEQRIGRLDRFGKKSGVIRHMILMPKTSEESPWYGWYELLARVFDFHQSIVSSISCREI